MSVGVVLSLLGMKSIKNPIEEGTEDKIDFKFIMRVSMGYAFSFIGYWLFFENEYILLEIKIVKWVALVAFFIIGWIVNRNLNKLIPSVTI